MRTHPTDARRRAFVLILVLVMIILITIISVTYLRVMRLRMINTSRSGGNIALAVDSARDLALTAIAADMPLRNSGQEPFDFPWTDANATKLPATLTYPTLQTGLSTLGNPARDDAWLASAAPEGGRWPHLSNLAGSFLDVASANLSKVPVNPATQLRVPSDKLSAGMENDVPFGDPRLADANGDGLGDSFWFYPPRGQVENTRYAAAVYIEDLSAKINLNTALPLRVGGAYAAAAPRAWTPSDVDLSALVPVAGAADAELAAMVRWRALDDAAAQPWADGKRRKFWGSRASRNQLTGEILASDTRRFTVDDEFELRFHGGINDRYATTVVSGQKVPVTTAVEIAGKGLPALLRAANTAALTESNWLDAGFPDADAFHAGNARNLLTTLSGDAARQVGLDGAFLAEEIRYNLNIQNPAHFAAAVGDTLLLKFFRGLDGLDGGTDDYAMPAGFQRFVPTLTQRPIAMAGQWLANLTDAKDRNNTVTRVPDGAGWWYGFEPLPLLSEVYMQRAYYKKASTGSGPYTLTCCASPTGAASGGNTASYAFELVNPYAFPIKLTNVDLAVQLPGAAGGIANSTGAPYALSTDLPAAAWTDRDNDNDPVLLPGHRLILWRNGNTAHANNDLTAQINAAVALDPVRNHKITCGMVVNDLAVTAIPAGGTGAAGAGFVRVDLLCYSALKDGTGVQREPGAYSTVVVPWLPNTFTEATASSPASVATNGLLGFRQVNGRAFGTDQGLNLLQCRHARWTGLALPNLGDTGSAAALVNVAVTGTAPNFGDTALKFTRVRDAARPYSAAYQTLGAAAKEILPAGRADLRLENLWFNQQTPSGQPRVAGDQFSSLMDLLRIPMAGMKGTSSTHRGNLTLQANGQYVETTVAYALYEALGATNALGDGTGGVQPLSSLCLPIAPGAQVYSANLATTSHKNAPFSWLLPCLCDTLNPAADSGLDVDSDGAKDWFDHTGNGRGLDANANGIQDWPAEVNTAGYLIPGRLNLNTVPRHLLAEALPIPNPTLRASLAAKIVAQRNGAPAAGTRAATDRGLSSVFEVLQDAPALTGFSGNPASRHDLVENLGCLPSVATCRSDFFAVHILVLGFDANDFSPGPVEQKRQLVLVSRTPLTANDKSQLKYWTYNY